MLTIAIIVGLVLQSCIIFAGAQTSSDRLASVIDDFYAWRLHTWPLYGTRFGINTYNDRIDEYTEEAFFYQKENATMFLTESRQIRTEGLSQQETISKIILEDQLQIFIDGYKYRRHGIYNSMTFIEHIIYDWRRFISWMPQQTSADYENLLSRYRAFPRELEQRTTLMREAIKSGTTGHLYSMENGLNALEEEVSKNAVDTLFYQPFSKPALANAVNNTDSLRHQCLDIINNHIFPAIQDFVSFIKREYYQHLREEPGVVSMPDGLNYYKACLKFHLSTDISPEEIHELGKSEVSRIKSLMNGIIEKEGFNGSLKEYIADLNSRADQYFSTSEELLKGYEELIEEIHPKLTKILSTVPDNGVVVVRSGNAVSRYSGPTAEGEPGTFYAYVDLPRETPKYGMVALTLHETQPGHHTMDSLQKNPVYLQGMYKNQDIPDFRNNIEFGRYNSIPFNWLFHTAYSEGWALYAEYLGEELGIYTDRTTLFGRYLSEIFRAARLVVDTGMHAYGWSFEEAEQYFQENTALGRTRIKSELKRYIGWPAQACAYKYGELKIRKLRNHAEEQLGDKFNLKDFHDQILSFGAAPLSLLEQHINDWIEVTSSSAAPVMSCTKIIVVLLVSFMAI